MTGGADRWPGASGELDRRALLEGGLGAALAAMAGCTGRDGGAGPSEGTDEAPDGGDPTATAAPTTAPSGVDGTASPSPPADVPTEPASEVTVRIETYQFRPDLVWIEPGGTVTWERDEDSIGVVAPFNPDVRPNPERTRRVPPVENDDTTWTVDLIPDGERTGAHQFTHEGVYDYFMDLAFSTGAVGSVVVGRPDPEDQPGLSEPREGSAVREDLLKLNRKAMAVLSDA